MNSIIYFYCSGLYNVIWKSLNPSQSYCSESWSIRKARCQWDSGCGPIIIPAIVCSTREPLSSLFVRQKFEKRGEKMKSSRFVQNSLERVSPCDTFGSVWLDLERRAKVGKHSEAQSAYFAVTRKCRATHASESSLPWADYAT
jgi:hypothetical protein